MWTAVVEQKDGSDDMLFASLDGEHFLGVTRLPRKGEEVQLEALFTGGKTRPMTVGRALLERDDRWMHAARFAEI